MGAVVQPIRKYKVFDDILAFLKEKDTESSAGNIKGYNKNKKKNRNMDCTLIQQLTI